ncbi:MAG: hypothetical protein KC636_27410, partial [Myxococcales bacterium]|nr:hypothetical protein [Myxococcales bacterium]
MGEIINFLTMFFGANVPALLVVIPLIGAITLAGLASLFPRVRAIAWHWSAVVTVVVAMLATNLFNTVKENGTLSYEMGNWPYAWGIEYRIDLLNAFILVVVAGIGAVSTLYAKISVEDEIPPDRHHFFYAVWLLAIVGLLGITITGDAFNIYVLLEISSLTIYALIAMGKDLDRRALTASLRYLILGSVGASFILLGIGYLLMVTGTLNIADMHEQLMAMAEPARHRTVLVAFAFLLVGLSLKMALWPLHMWLPNA